MPRSSAEAALPPRLLELIETLDGLDRGGRAEALISIAERLRGVPERGARRFFIVAGNDHGELTKVRG